jgi:hypothetical protein
MIEHTIQMHNENSVWSPAMIFYIILSTLLTFIIWWSTTYPHFNDKVEDSEMIIAMTISYLLFGLIITMMASHNKNHMISWFIIIGTLIPVVFAAFWLIYNNHNMKIADSKR